MAKIFSVLAIVVGTVLLASAVFVRWGVAPNKAVLPADTNTLRTYAGTASALLNPAALTGRGGPVLAKNVPVTVQHRDRVLQTKGSDALVTDTKIVLAAGNPVASVEYRYAVNRTNLGPGSGFPDTVTHQGLTFNWPVLTQKHDYTGWVSDTHRAVTLKYSGTAKRGGASVYVYTVSTTPAAITDAQVLSGLPAALPKAQVIALAQSLGLTSAQLAQLATLAPTLPDPVTFAYTYQVSATYYVAPKTGIVVDLTEHEARTLMLPVGSITVPVTPIMDMTFTSTPATLAAAVKDARTKGDAVTTIYTTVPLSLALTGGGLLFGGLLGLVAIAFGRRPEPLGGNGSHEAINPITTSH